MVGTFAALVLGLFAYEAFALRQNKGYTISEIIWHLSYHWPLVPFLFGVLSGHFFWQSARCAEMLK